jgi:hypothetical protein
VAWAINAMTTRATNKQTWTPPLFVLAFGPAVRRDDNNGMVLDNSEDSKLMRHYKGTTR